MKKFTITRNSFEGDSYKCVMEFETEQEFLDWAATKKHLGRRDWSLPKYTDENDVEQFPEGCELDGNGDPIEVVVDYPETTGVDDVGNEIIIPAYSVTQYKMPDQWSYTEEDISVELSRKERIDAFKSEVSSHKKQKEFCLELIDWVGAKNDEKGLTTEQRNDLLEDPYVKAIVEVLSVGFLSKAEELIAAYIPDGTLFTAQNKTDLQQIISDFKDS